MIKTYFLLIDKATRKHIAVKYFESDPSWGMAEISKNQKENVIPWVDSFKKKDDKIEVAVMSEETAKKMGIA